MYKFNIQIINANATGKYSQIYSPFDNTLIGEVEIPDDLGIEQALLNSALYFETIMKHKPAHERAAILYKVSDKIKENLEELAQLIASEGGKPVKDARIEVARAANTVKMSGDEALQLNGEQITMDRSKGSENHLAFTIVQPLGPVLAISAFNHPVNLICHQVATAFAAGNSVIVKPASQTPLSCFKICEYFEECGLEKGIINVLPIPGSKMDLVVSDPRIRFVTFIGSAEVGFQIQKKVADGVGVSLEHGGTAVAVVDKSADLATTIPSIIKGGFYHAGQVCVSTQNVFIHDSIYDETVSQLIEAAKLLKIGNPNNDDTDIGPIINKYEHSRVLNWIETAITMGANLLLGGAKDGETCIEATILENTDYTMDIMKSEVFGPVINLNKYSDLNSVIKKCNHTPFSFQNAIYSQDIDVAFHFAKEVDSKAVIINDSTAFRVDWMPFGGSKESGFHVGGIKYSIKDMTEEKLIVIKNKGII